MKRSDITKDSHNQDAALTGDSRGAICALVIRATISALRKPLRRRRKGVTAWPFFEDVVSAALLRAPL
ncbi:hypothetical protein ANANG_G00295050 [Anguilla anguilla]|uniref:Uncharacterized protein n=1 Tax=Anguilla anguilla TaxID=7936 RepID=A0A9D3LM33_ANGAN|nr:hypothetical protein ANANG_G00295050 [Anguilla anguilla]